MTSPPYATQREYDATSGFKPVRPDEYVEWFGAVAAGVESILAPDGSYFLNIKEHADDGERDLYVMDLVIAHRRQWGWRFVDTFCWRKTDNGVPGGWGIIASEFDVAHQSVETLKGFLNTVLAELWTERGSAPDWEKIYLRREEYPLGTVAITTSAGSGAGSILTATGKAALGLDAVVAPTCEATPFKMTAAGKPSIVVATGPLTAGVIEAWVLYAVASA